MRRFFSSASLPARVAPGGRPGKAKLVTFVAGLAIIAAFPATAFASHLSPGMSVSINGGIHLVNGVYLAVPVQVTCPALSDPLSAIFADGVDVSITEKTGKTFAFGSGFLGYQSPAANGVTFGSPVICDGTAHAYTVNVFPSIPDSSPFHGGPAVASGDFDLGVYDPSSCVFCTLDDNFVRFGPQSISIH